MYLYNVVPEEPGERLGEADVVFLRHGILTPRLGHVLSVVANQL